jgi:tRNA A-37 threonylcarbamoyl transferase component Bud32
VALDTPDQESADVDFRDPNPRCRHCLGAVYQGETDRDDRATHPSDATSVRLVAWDGESTRDVTFRDAEPGGAGFRPRVRESAEAEPAPAMRIGRYDVLRELGRGGMGVTYVAYDEDLDRKVALKLVRSELLGEESQKRLRREAQALARLAHPNIVAVHDVGSHHGQAFIAMEFVPGQTASAWAAARPRTWSEVISVFCQAGEGLRVAHAAGLVHRDIKPANIIVGDDGRVRVLDFGLARQALRDDELEAAGALDTIVMDDQLTSTGVLVGTLRYMAPEHLDRGIANARSDQFSFCVSLFETLYNRAPFAGATPRARLAAMRQGKIAEVPGKSPVPRWLHVVIVRGLAFAPEARWPSMDELLAELARDPTRIRRRRWTMGALVAGIAALSAALIAGGFVVRERRAAVCSSAGARIDEVWSNEQQPAIEQAMLATGVSYAQDTWQHTRALLDRYATDWAAAYTDACEATAVLKEQSEDSFDQRIQCLARRRRSLRVLVDELARIDAASIARAIDAAGRLPLIASCGDPEVAAGYAAARDRGPSAGRGQPARGLLHRADRGRSPRRAAGRRAARDPARPSPVAPG